MAGVPSPWICVMFGQRKQLQGKRKKQTGTTIFLSKTMIFKEFSRSFVL